MVCVVPQVLHGVNGVGITDNQPYWGQMMPVAMAPMPFSSDVQCGLTTTMSQGGLGDLAVVPMAMSPEQQQLVPFPTTIQDAWQGWWWNTEDQPVNDVTGQEEQLSMEQMEQMEHVHKIADGTVQLDLDPDADETMHKAWWWSNSDDHAKAMMAVPQNENWDIQQQRMDQAGMWTPKTEYREYRIDGKKPIQSGNLRHRRQQQRRSGSDTMSVFSVSNTEHSSWADETEADPTSALFCGETEHESARRLPTNF